MNWGVEIFGPAGGMFTSAVVGLETWDGKRYRPVLVEVNLAGQEEARAQGRCLYSSRATAERRAVWAATIMLRRGRSPRAWRWRPPPEAEMYGFGW